MAVTVPELAQARAVEHPPGQVEERGEHDPDRELADVAAHEPDRPEQREHDRDPAEEQRPEPARVEAEHPIGERGRRRRDDQQLEDRPAEVLDDVEEGRQVRAALPERRAEDDHPRHARVGADRAGDPEQQVPDERGRDDRDERRAEREAEPEVAVDEHGARDDHEQAYGEAAPEQEEVDEPEHAQALGHRLDAPARCPVVHRLPPPALPGSGSSGVISAACAAPRRRHRTEARSAQPGPSARRQRRGRRTRSPTRSAARAGSSG